MIFCRHNTDGEIGAAEVERVRLLPVFETGELRYALIGLVRFPFPQQLERV